MHANTLNRCPVCGYLMAAPPYDEHCCATFEICPCCGTEFGYDDSAASHQVLRETWIKRGMPWWSRHQIPVDGWDPKIQLADAGFEIAGKNMRTGL